MSRNGGSSPAPPADGCTSASTGAPRSSDGSRRWGWPSSSPRSSPPSARRSASPQGTTTPEQAATQIQNQDPQTVGIVGIIVLAVIAFVSYYGGGYVAARMSRFDGPRQGFAVWLWAVLVAVVVAVVAAVAGARFDVLSTLNTFPRWPVDQGNVTGTGIVALLLLLAITLLGAVIGGAGGMRYHRKLETAEAEYLRVVNVSEGMRGPCTAHTLRVAHARTPQRTGTSCR